MPTSHLPPPPLGRRDETAALDALWEGTAADGPRIAVVAGPAGAGKSHLVDAWLRRRAVAGPRPPRVLRAAGCAWETEVDGGVLDQLLPPEEDGPAEGRGPRLLAALAAAPRLPTLLVVDNLQWADEASLRALAYALRRTAGRVLAVLAVRDTEEHLLPAPFLDLLRSHLAATVPVGALPAGVLAELAVRDSGVDLPGPAAHRLAAYCGGNPRHVLDLLAENPPGLWRQWHRELPAPLALAREAGSALGRLDPGTRALVEAAAVLGTEATVFEAASLAGLADPLPAVADARHAGLLRVAGEVGGRVLAFPSDVHRAAAYAATPLVRRTALHDAAGRVVRDEGRALAHRAAACLLPDSGLAGELEDFARRQADSGAWSSAADALVTAGKLTPGGRRHESLLLEAVDALVGAGEVPRAAAYEDEVGNLAASPQRDAVLGYLAILQGRQRQAEARLAAGWAQALESGDRAAQAQVAQRRVLHALARWDGPDLVEWSVRSAAAAEPGSPAERESLAIRGLGVAAMGRSREAEIGYNAMLRTEGLPVAQAQRLRMARGWLLLATDRPDAAREDLSGAVSTAFSSGSYRISLWASAWLARAQFALGAWDEALQTVERGLELQRETGAELLRPLLHWTAAQILGLRGEWGAADRHVADGRADSGDYPMMQLAHRMAAAHVAEAKTDYAGVLEALGPVAAWDGSRGLGEPGFWPWQDTYANALAMSDRTREAEEFVAGHAERARARGHRSMQARLAYVQGRIAANDGDTDAARAHFERGLEHLRGLALPYERARVDYAYGQTLRRAGKRRESTGPLHRARKAFAALTAEAYVQRCDRELQAAGVSAPRRGALDFSTLTAQEAAVARLVADGATNKRAAAELFVSVKTVQYHLTRTYAKLGVASRSELAALYRQEEAGE